MGVVGDFIDSRSPAQKDRIIRAREWTFGAFERRTESIFPNPKDVSEMVHAPTGRCLTAHAFNTDRYTWMVSRYADPSDGWRACNRLQRVLKAYDKLCVRFGVERVVRAIKKRAGASIEELDVSEPVGA